MSKLGPISHFLFLVSCDSLVLQGLRCEWGAGVLNLVLSLSLSHTWSLEVQHGTSWQRTLWGFEKRIVALHKDDIGYKKFAKTLKLSCSTVAKTTQWFNRTGSTQNRPRHGWPKKLSARAQHHIQRLCLGIDVWVLPALQQRLKGWGVSLSVLCMAVVPEGSLF